MRELGWIVLALVGLSTVPEGSSAPLYEAEDTKEVPCFDYPPAPANELELVKCKEFCHLSS